MASHCVIQMKRLNHRVRHWGTETNRIQLQKIKPVKENRGENICLNRAQIIESIEYSLLQLKYIEFYCLVIYLYNLLF